MTSQFLQEAWTDSALTIGLSRRRWGQLALAATTGLVAWPLRFAHATETTPPANCDRVEEDWELVVGEPDPDNNAPQIINVLSPLSDQSASYAMLEINHATQPEFQEGGLQLQRWLGDSFRDQRTTANDALLATSGESIHYTLSMSIANNQLTYSVKNGQSTTWGNFGSDLTLSSWTLLQNFSGYSPSASTGSATIGYAAHRVELLRLARVRYYHNNVLQATDETVRQVHPAE